MRPSRHCSGKAPPSLVMYFGASCRSKVANNVLDLIGDSRQGPARFKTLVENSDIAFFPASQPRASSPLNSGQAPFHPSLYPIVTMPQIFTWILSSSDSDSSSICFSPHLNVRGMEPSPIIIIIVVVDGGSYSGPPI